MSDREISLTMAAHVMLTASGTTGGAINLSIILITNTLYTDSTKGGIPGKVPPARAPSKQL